MSKLIGFIGSPSSGKTTTAAMLFCELKKRGISAEFVSEYARYYIAVKKMGNHNIELNDTDQKEIMRKQFNNEGIFWHSQSEDGYVVVDGSYLNSLLYMNYDQVRFSIESMFMWYGKPGNLGRSYHKLFLCRPLEFNDKDSNRIHTKEQSLEIDSKIKDTFLKAGINPTMIELPSNWNRLEIIKKELNLT